MWKVLGIAPTNDKRTIRSAYSAQSRQCHPEENPEEFQRLHEAYQAALAFAAANQGRTGREAENVPGLGTVRMQKKTLAEESGKESGNEPDKSDETPSGISADETDQDIPAEQTQTTNKEQTALEPETLEPAQPSLLARLEQAEEQEFEKSMASGALKQFSAILNDPKKFRKADAWKGFFSSEEFLLEQYSESFANGMLRILQGFHTLDNFCIAQMPSGFLLELAIAYALVLNAEQEDRKETVASFYAREIAASIWNMQQTEYSVPVRLLFKPENQVRMRSFADYIRLKSFNSRGLLIQQNQDIWKEMLRGGKANYLYELKGKGTHDIYPGSRSVCSLALYTFWVRTESIPKCVLEYMYKEYGLRGVEHTSTRKLYETLKKEIVRQYPDIEDALYGEEGRAVLVGNWYRELMQIISDSETLYEETEEIKERVRALFAREEWGKIRFLPELFEKMYLQLHDRSVMPASIAKQLYGFYSQEEGNSAWGAEQGEIMLEGMIHSLYYGRIVLDMHGRIPDATPYFAAGKLCEVRKAGSGEELDKGGLEHARTDLGSGKELDKDNLEHARTSSGNGCGDVCSDFGKGYPKVLANQDFWHYFLMRAFGCWNVLMGGGNRCRRGYTMGMMYSLPSYIEYLYQPSKRWQKLFIGSYGRDDVPVPEFCSYFADENGVFVPGVEFTLPDGHNLRAEFYLHYVRYFLDGEEIFLPVYHFDKGMELAKSIKEPEQFFILLAITKISEEDYKPAAEWIEAWLSRLPLAPVSIPVIAGLLAGRDEKIQEGLAQTDEEDNYSKNRTDLIEKDRKNRKDTLGMGRNLVGQEKREKSKKQKGISGQKNAVMGVGIYGIYYMEENELCFRAVVRENGFDVSRLTTLKWEHVHTVSFGKEDGVLSAEEKKRQAQEFLQGMKHPVPVLRSQVSLEGLENEQKAEKILEALKQDARYHKQDSSLLPYAPGYPWKEEDTGRKKSGEENADEEASSTVLQRFYRQHGGFLSESYCVLHFEPEDTQDKKIHVFYSSMKPFGFGLASRSSDWPSSYQYREEELHRKVKEKHWIIGHFGWGDTYGPDGDAVPEIVALGESGTFYYYDVVRLLRGESLAVLLAKIFDFSNIVAVENYEGNLSISRFSGELEYCYDKKAFLDSAYTVKKTGADLFTIFTKAEMMEEFTAWMDCLLKDARGEEAFSGIYFEFWREAKGIYSMHVLSWEEETAGSCEMYSGGDVFAEEWEEDEEFEEDAEDWKTLGNHAFRKRNPVYKSLMQDKRPLIWKIWQQDGDFAIMLKDFTDVLYWYMDCGGCGKELVDCAKITVGFVMADGGEARVSAVYEKGGTPR